MAAKRLEPLDTPLGGRCQQALRLKPAHLRGVEELFQQSQPAREAAFLMK
ncbi:hypothetical protein [Salinithrix halophila]|uniref:Uncharacterized protein n=1 Tax=Salinithrix halophila TaxID=1485204 RepID=A0ABV8JDZ9_9BACL